MLVPPALRRALVLLALPIALLTAAETARAQCSAGVASGACPSSDAVWTRGCCQNGSKVAFCEAGTLCVLDCRTEFAAFAPYCGLEEPGFPPYCVEQQQTLTGNEMCPGAANCSCSGRQCGDNGCGTSCGSCGPNQTCTASGMCEGSGGGGTGCTPSCNGRQCGNDGCGGSCGSCGPNTTCNAAGQCEGSGGGGTGCTPSCGGRACGDDGCGGTCGTCGDGETCNSGTCEAEAPTCGCQGKACGDDGCGQNCGFCGPGLTCEANQCVGGTADPAPGGGDALIPPQECPAGQVWNGVAGACVLLGATSDGAGSEDGGCHGGAGGGLLMGLGGVLAALLRRTAGPSSGSAPGSSGRRAA